MCEPNPEKLNELVGRLLNDVGAAISGASVLLGDRLGLYKAMADGKSVTPAELATKTRDCTNATCANGCRGQAASGYIDYRSAERNVLPLPRAGDGLRRGGLARIFRRRFRRCAVDLSGRTAKSRRRFEPARAWAGTNIRCACSRGTERFFRPGYNANLVSSWIPALDGVEAKLKAGAKVADVGCGHGASTILMAQAYPNSTLLRLRLSRALDRDAPGNWRRRPASATASPSRKPAPRIFRREATISSRSSIACTTWAIRWARASM